MREEFAREFPSAGRALSMTRSRLFDPASKLRRESVAWGTVSGIGAGFLVSSVTQFLVGLFFLALRAFDGTTPLTLGWPSTVLGTASAVAVALRVGGPLSLVLYLVYLGVGIALQIPGVITFCERSGFGDPSLCSPVGFIAARWALWCGIGLGLLLSRMIAARAEGANLTLRVAGTYAIAWTIVIDLWALAVSQNGDATSGMNASIALSMLFVAAAIAAGIVAATSDDRLRTAAVVAGFLVLPWLTLHLPLQLSQFAMAAQSQNASEFLPAMLIGAFSTPVAALALVLTAMVADRERYIPRDTA